MRNEHNRLGLTGRLNGVGEDRAPSGQGYGQAANLGRPGAALLQTPAAGTAMFNGFSQDISDLKNVVKDLVTEVRQRTAPEIPEPLFDYYMQLTKSLVADEIARQIIGRIQKSCRPEQLSDAARVRGLIADEIEKLVPVCGPISRTKTTGPHVVALIGPTGVGKTTTIAKLAANLKLREKHKVGLITIDTYRIAAIDQLKKYADILGAPLKVVGRPDDIAEAVQSMDDCAYVLIDTAGRSPRDSLKLGELRRYLDLARPDEVHLVLSTTSSGGVLDLALEKFAEVKFDKVIFTKLDETSQLGLVLTVVQRLGKGLSYVTNGQDVPNDIEIGHGRRLAQLIMQQNAEGGLV